MIYYMRDDGLCVFEFEKEKLDQGIRKYNKHKITG